MRCGRDGFKHVQDVWQNTNPHRPENMGQQQDNVWSVRPLCGVLRHLKVHLLQHDTLACALYYEICTLLIYIWPNFVREGPHIFTEQGLIGFKYDRALW